MPEFLTLIPPEDARRKWFSHIDPVDLKSEIVDILHTAGRISAEEIRSPQSLPHFKKSTVDGYAVIARDTFGAGESMPAYLKIAGEIPMGSAIQSGIEPGTAFLIHTGGAVPEGSDAIVMLENTQVAPSGEIEISRAVAVGENIIHVGEDIRDGEILIEKGRRIRPSEVGALAAVGITNLRVANKVRVGIISTGDEVVDPSSAIGIGQVRDINSYTLAALLEKETAEPKLYGIVEDDFEKLLKIAAKAFMECDALLITAGSSASIRDMTANVINELGDPGVLVHGINTKPGKPTILGVCNGKAVVGLPGNPVSALVNGMLFVLPLVDYLAGILPSPFESKVQARLMLNLPSQAGREDWHPVRLIRKESDWIAEPVFGKSNLIFTLSTADGLICIPADSTGLSAGELVDVHPL